jgi:Cu/Ag efflux protein CusF
MKNKMMKLAGALLITAVPLMLTSCASTSSSQDESMSNVQGGAIAVDAVQGTDTIQSVDPATRTVVLMHSDGTTSSYVCGSDVRNFDQIKVGDQVTATVAESVAIVLVKGGMAPAAGTTSVMVRAPLGAKPSGKMVDTIGFTAKVISVDDSTRMVTLQTPDGQNQTVKVGPNVDLSNVNPGDDVGVQITRAFAIAVTSPNNSSM